MDCVNTNNKLEASSMLEEAIKQMDDILISSPNLLTNNLNPDISCSNVINTAHSLSVALSQIGLQLAPSPEPESRIIFNWLEPFFHHANENEKCLHFKNELQELSNKFRNLSETAAQQTSKILNLEKQLTEKTLCLNNYQDQLQKSQLSISSLENKKLAALSALSELHLKVANLEQENLELKNNIPRNIGSIERIDILKNSSSYKYKLNSQCQYHSLPRQSYNKSSKLSNSQQIQEQSKNVAFAESTTVSIIQPNLFPEKENFKGIKHIWGKLRRCNSGNLEEYLLDDSFRRGSNIRSTTNGRIEYPTKLNEASLKSYRLWNLQDICNWLSHLQMDIYINDCRRWLGKGNHQDIFDVSPIDISRELNLKHQLHRKKIILALNELVGKETDITATNAGKLNNIWVIRWLDDIGLPQYKDTFMEAIIDGRMLHKLTMDDLNQLQVTSCLHIASIKNAIFVSGRLNNWKPDSLIRRSKEDNSSNENSKVYLWTAHRVMEWLKAVDLAEYAPNLRGAGVHGGLIYFEPRFNADLLADLLSIPSSKTLLRRHLATHFKELLGHEKIKEKRDAESNPNIQSLTIAAKMKFPKKTQFSLKRRKSSKSAENIDWSDYVCPMNFSTKQN